MSKSEKINTQFKNTFVEGLKKFSALLFHFDFKPSTDVKLNGLL